jgi:hypothetical protein
MNYGQVTTFGTGAALASVVTGQLWLAATAIGLTISLALAIRIVWRRGRKVDDL